MPDQEDLTAFISQVLDRLDAPVNAYFDAVDAAQAPQSGLARFFQGVTSRLTELTARRRAGNALSDALSQSHIVAAILGNDGQALDAARQALVMDTVAEQQGYLDGFMRDLSVMSREAAVQRIHLYVNSVVQTVSKSTVIGLPTLPHYPGDLDLGCHGFCKCHLEIEPRGPGNWDVYWVVDPEAEHCEDCLKLGVSWNPLRIENGHVIEKMRRAA